MSKIGTDKAKKNERLRLSGTARLIRSFRLGRHITQKQLAFNLNIRENYLWQIENGQKLPSVTIILRFASIFQISPTFVKRVWLEDYVSLVEQHVKRNLEL